MILTAPSRYLAMILEAGEPKTKFGQLLQAKNPAEAMDKEAERLKDKADVMVIMEYLEVGLLLAERLLFARAVKKHPQLTAMLPEVLDYQTALSIAYKNNQMLTKEQLKTLLNLLQTDELMQPTK